MSDARRRSEGTIFLCFFRLAPLSERGAEERSAGDVESYMQSQSDSSARLGDVMGDLGRKLADVETPEGDDGAEATE